ncbi:MAG: flagellar motor protein [Bryobacteraceae bacterium]|nr:flagellar motor protein [Bryobacteraceae bacterium]
MNGSGKVRLVPDLASILGLVVGFGGILGGLVLEGGRLSDIAQLTGALIVISGTLGAVMVTTPPKILMGAAARLWLVLMEPRYSAADVISGLLSYSNKARRNGIVSLEAEADMASDPFLRKALTLAVDGTEPAELRNMMELDMELEAQKGKAEARVYEAAGGYSPTIGIIGAVLGLIQVMKNLQEIDKVGHGIAVAFVATVYGVGLANLLLLPAASKIRTRVDEKLRIQALVVEGVCAIVQGAHPKMIESRLEAFAPGKPSPGGSFRRADGFVRESV